MSLNEVAASNTAPGLMAPKPKLNGINVPKVVLDEVLEILEIERDSFLMIGGDTKKTSMSDIVTAALRDYVRAWRKRQGLLTADDSIPKDAAARRQFVRQVGLSNLERLRANLLNTSDDSDDGQ